MARRPAGKAGSPGAGAPGALSASTRVALLMGPELMLHAEHTAALRRALESAHGRVGVFRFDGAAAPVADVLDECRTFGLTEPFKLVIVDNADQFLRARGEGEEEGDRRDSPEGLGGEGAAARGAGPARRELLERYVAAPCESATLLLRSAKKFTVGRLGPLIEKAGAVLKCEELRSPEARAWAIRRAADTHGVELAGDAADLLVERVGTDLSRLESELGKLAAGAGDAGVVTSEAVRELVGRSRDEEVWVIQSALLSGDAATALRSVREALDVSRHHPVLVSWACVDLARKLHGAASGLAAGMRTWDLAGTLRLWGSSRDAVLEAARRVTPAQAADLLREAVESDVRQKTGAGDPVRGLEILALRFARV